MGSWNHGRYAHFRPYLSRMTTWKIFDYTFTHKYMGGLSNGASAAPLPVDPGVIGPKSTIYDPMEIDHISVQ